MATGFSTPITDLRGYLTHEEVQTILNHATNPRDKLLIMTLYLTGRRVSEVIKMRVMDIDFENNQIVWNILKKRKRIGITPFGRFVFKPRPHQERYTEHPRLIQLLKEYIQHKELDPDDKVFFRTRQRVFQIVRKVGLAAGITHVGDKQIHPHHFRHSHAINFIRNMKNAGDIKKLQKRLNHSNIDMTMHYLQFGYQEDAQILQDGFKLD
jgi:integrase/recombinase XerC/integrase/recombinase XerD